MQSARLITYFGISSIKLGAIEIPCNFFIKETTELSDLSLGFSMQMKTFEPFEYLKKKL